MSGRLLVNVAVDGAWFGPSYGNADQVPSAVAARIDPSLFAGAEHVPVDGTPGEATVPPLSAPPAPVAPPDPDPEPEVERPAVDPRSLADLTVDQLKAVAADADIDLGQARRKADIIAVLAPALDAES